MTGPPARYRSMKQRDDKDGSALFDGQYRFSVNFLSNHRYHSGHATSESR